MATKKKEFERYFVRIVSKGLTIVYKSATKKSKKVSRLWNEAIVKVISEKGTFLEVESRSGVYRGWIAKECAEKLDKSGSNE